MSSAEIHPFHGYVDTTGDALRLIQAARCGLIPRITRRLNELERRSMIKSGAVFIFSVEESGIKRWTEGLQWSPSRIQGNFLVYREVTERPGRTSKQQDSPDSPHRGDLHVTLKPNGLTKKTITVKIDGSDHHLISYFKLGDVESGHLRRPNTRPEFMELEIPPELVQTTNFRYPPKIEPGPDGRLTRIRDSDEVGRLIESNPDDAPGISRPRAGHTGGSLSSSPETTLSRISTHSPEVQGSGRRFDPSYAPTLSPHSRDDLHSPSTVSSQSIHAYYGRNMDQSASSPGTSLDWAAPGYLPYQATTAAPPSMAYPYPSESTHAFLHPTAMLAQGNWGQQHATTPSRAERYPSLNTGQVASVSWGSEGHLALPEQPLTSAPPMPSTYTSSIPMAERREHMRTRSVPSTWSWDQQGSMPSQQELPPGYVPARDSMAPPVYRSGSGEDTEIQRHREHR